MVQGILDLGFFGLEFLASCWKCPWLKEVTRIEHPIIELYFSIHCIVSFDITCLWHRLQAWLAFGWWSVFHPMPTSRKAFELRSATSVVCRNIWLFTTVHFAKDFVNFAKLNNYFFLSKKTFQPLGQYAKGMIFLFIIPTAILVGSPMLVGPPSCQQEVYIIRSSNSNRKYMNPFTALDGLKRIMVLAVLIIEKMHKRPFSNVVLWQYCLHNQVHVMNVPPNYEADNLSKLWFPGSELGRATIVLRSSINRSFL